MDSTPRRRQRTSKLNHMRAFQLQRKSLSEGIRRQNVIKKMPPASRSPVRGDVRSTTLLMGKGAASPRHIAAMLLPNRPACRFSSINFLFRRLLCEGSSLTSISGKNCQHNFFYQSFPSWTSRTTPNKLKFRKKVNRSNS